jgi:hypothetical protein
MPEMRVATDIVQPKPLKKTGGRLAKRSGLSPLEVCRKAKRLGITKVILAFSGGKDSCAGFCTLRDAGIEAVPVMKVQFPDLDLDNNIIAFYEKFFQTKIHKILHTAFYDTCRFRYFADPIGCRIFEKLNLKEAPDNNDQQEKWKRWNNLTALPTALCIKKGDSAQRMMAILRKGGEISRDLRTIYPMANASDKMVYEILVAHKCPLPSFYLENFESRDGLRITTLDWIREHAPNDWQKIKFWWPLVEAEYRRLGRNLDGQNRPGSAAFTEAYP